jgi:restriction endonuclease S subunit
MAKEDERKPTAAEKGKGKAVNGDAEKEVKKDKDGKPIEDDKKGAVPDGMSARSNCGYSYLLYTCSNVCRRGTQRRGPGAQERTRHAC